MVLDYIKERILSIPSSVVGGLRELGGELKKICTAHHVLNILLTASFYFTKSVLPLCQLIYGSRSSLVQCGMVDRREHEVLVFVAVVIFWKNRKSTSWMHYLSNIFLFGRLANLVLFFRADPLVGVVYSVLCLVSVIVVPEPAFSGPEQITYYQGANLQEELARDHKCTYMIEFYTSWSPECQRIAPVFAQLSQQFSLPNLKFGKLDVGRFGSEAEHFRVNTHPTSRQLPTIALFKNGKEQMRRPLVHKGRAMPFVFKQINVMADFDLINLHKECKENVSKYDRKKLKNDKLENDKDK